MSPFHEAPEEAESSHERWLVSYADLMTLMFAFFTVLYATSEQNTEKAKEFQESIKHYLIKAGPMGGTANSKVNTNELGETPLESPIKVFKQTKTEAAVEVEKISEKIESTTSETDRKRFLNDIYSDDLGLRVVLFGDAIFAGSTEKLNPDAVAFINKLASLLAESKRRIYIQSLIGTETKLDSKQSWELASSRAVNVLRFLEVKHQISSHRLTAGSAVGSSAKDRLEFVLIHDDIEM